MEALKKKKYTVEEFNEMPEDERYELIDGELYAMAEPSRIHQELVAHILNKIMNFIDSNKGDCRVFPGPFGVRLWEEADTVVEPDITVVCDKNKLTKKGCTGAPDWIIEIASPSNLRHDYIDKLELYMKAGVREYWIVNPDRKSLTVYNEENPYIPGTFSFEKPIRAGIYADLEIDFAQIMERVE